MSESQKELLEQRYGKENLPDRMIWNDRIEGLLAHRSVRAFLPDPLPDGAVETMVAAAQSASSSSNLHHWSVVAVTDKDLKEQLTQLTRSQDTGGALPFINEAPVILLWVADNSRNHAITTASGKTPATFDYLDSFAMATVDTAIAAQNAVVAAETIGLGAVYIGAMRNRAKELAELVGLPKYSFVPFGLAVGLPDTARSSRIRPRPPQEVVLHYNRYDTSRSEGWLDNYEAVFEEFRTASRMRPRTWAEGVLKGTSLPYMDGRENLRTTVEERGYELG